MDYKEFFDTKIGDQVRLNTELWLGQGKDKDKIVLKENQVFTVTNGLVGFFNYFLYVEAEDGSNYKFKIQSLERVSNSPTLNAGFFL